MKKIAIIGGSYLQLPLVQKAKEMSIETHCFAWREGAVCDGIADFFYPISITEKDRILEICKNVEIDGVVTIASDLAVLTVNYIANKLGLSGNDDEYSQAQTDKYIMREVLCILDTNKTDEDQITSYLPKYTIVEKISRGCDMIGRFPRIVKPTDRSGSRGVTKVEDGKEQEIAIERALNESFSKRIIVEEYIEGDEVSVESISLNGKHYVLQITDKATTGAPNFVELAHHQPSLLSKKIQKRIKDLVPRVLDALHISNGASHSEIKVTPEGDLKIIEIGARMGGDFIGSDLVMLSTGYDFLKGVIEVSLGVFNEPKISYNKCSGVFFLSRETPNIKNFIDHSSQYPEIIKSEITDKELHSLHQSADRSGYFIYQSNKRFNI